MIRVGINGYGTIGKRVADAISLQDDMKVTGVTKTRPDFEAELALKKGYKLFSAIPGNEEKFEDRGINIEGDIENLIEEVDIIVDCSPGGYGAENRKVYEKHGVKAIFQGGEKADIAETSFISICNYEEGVGKDYIRVVSCNTTGMGRIASVIDSEWGIEKMRVVVIRRAVDPKDDRKGPINAIAPNPVKLPSHHGEDLKTVMPHLDVVTSAVKVPTTLMHVHMINVELKNDPERSELIDVMKKEPRIGLFNSSEGFKSTASIIEYAREIRQRNDLWENCVWEDSVAVKDGEVYLFQAIHQEAIVVPENVDAVRAMMGFEDREKSIMKTNRSLGLL